MRDGSLAHGQALEIRPAGIPESQRGKRILGSSASSLASKVVGQVLVQIVHAMNREGRSYKGMLYAGLMLTKGGVKVLEDVTIPSLSFAARGLSIPKSV